MRHERWLPELPLRPWWKAPVAKDGRRVERPCVRPHLEHLETRLVPSSPDSAPSLGPPPPPGPDVVWVDNEPALRDAVSNLQSGETIVLQPGTYALSSTLYIGLYNPVTDVTLRGATADFNDVVLTGNGMENADYGAVPMGISVWDAQQVTIANLSVGDVYYHPIELKGDAGASAITLYHDRLFDAGEQFVKADPNPEGGGVDDSTVEYTVLEYTSGPPATDHGGGTGYTNGVDVHTGNNRVIANNLFRNFHTPDDANNLWAPAVLVWDHSSNATVVGNTFINVDRAIAFGLDEVGYDNQGGTIQNNFVYMDPGLYSPWRTAGSDAAIIVWDSPGTTVYHNTVLTNGNLNESIDVRFESTTDIPIVNNLTDGPLGARDGASYIDTNNFVYANPDMFVNPSAGDLHLVANDATLAFVIGQASTLPDVPVDWDGEPRPSAKSPTSAPTSTRPRLPSASPGGCIPSTDRHRPSRTRRWPKPSFAGMDRPALVERAERGRRRERAWGSMNAPGRRSCVCAHERRRAAPGRPVRAAPAYCFRRPDHTVPRGRPRRKWPSGHAPAASGNCVSSARLIRYSQGHAAHPSCAREIRAGEGVP